ncbi:MAG: hypothetical protein HYX38_10285 [Rhodospirillales bacterium]|nr:hypothetical protein [Rhodospirillales bacterium]
MQPTFDPVRKRQFWLDFNLAYEMRFEPDEIPAKGQPLYLSTRTNSLVTAYLLGLGDRVRPALEVMVEWMEGRPEPAVGLFDDEQDHWRDGWFALYAWRRALGVAKWLCSIDGAESDFKRALLAEWQGWEQADPEDATRDFHLRREALPEHLSMALAARDPAAVLPLRSAAGVTTIAEGQPPLLILGQYACLYLHAGNGRDDEFDANTTHFLRAGMWPELLSQGRYTQAALWLKALFWDSGAAKTPEEAMARAYDFMPARRPDFLAR